MITQSASADGDERQAEPVHRPEEPAVELEAELVAAVGEQHDVDGERADEVPDDGADGALVGADDEGDRRADRDQRRSRRSRSRTATGRSSTRKSDVICG